MSSGITITVMLVWGVPRIATVLCVHSLFCILLAEISAKVALCGPLIPNDTHFWPKFRPASLRPILNSGFTSGAWLAEISAMVFHHSCQDVDFGPFCVELRLLLPLLLFLLP